MSLRGEETRKKLLAYIKSSIQEHGFPPTIAEMSSALGIRPNGIRHQLLALEKSGHISRPAHKARAITVIKDF